MPEDTQKIDMNDGELWSEMDLTDLKNSLAHGDTIEQAAVFLCRSSTIDEVRRKVEELGLQYRSEPLPPPVPTRKITKAEVIELEGGGFGVAYEFDDGDRIIDECESKELAEFAAKDRVGDPVPIPGTY